MSVTLTRSRTQNPNPDSVQADGAPTAGENRGQIDRKKLAEEQDRDELLRRFIEWHRSSRDHFQESRQLTEQCYDFVAGAQWSDEDQQILSDQGRPAVTFNRVAPFVDGVSGMEINNRQETAYLPRTVGKSGVNELLTGAAQWVRQECDAEEEESEAFRDAIICGTGWTQTRMDYKADPDGMIVIERVDPLEIYPDPSSRKPNYADARFVIRVKDVPVETAEEMYPETPTVDLHARWAEDQLADSPHSPHNARLAPYYRIDQAGEIDRQRQQCRLVEVEWWDWIKAWRVLDPASGRFIRLDDKAADLYERRATMLGIKPIMIRDKQQRYYKAIVGNVVLDVRRGADEGGFTYKAMTAKRDRNRGCWYGLVRGMIDPQMWTNKFMSQSLHIVNTNAKGGLLAETDAFVDIEEARNNWAESDSIIELNPGGLAKVKDKQAPVFPVQINQMMQTALEAIPATAGVNLEMIAQQQQMQPGVLEMQRKQQGMTVLAYLFNAKKRYQKEQGRLMLWMIQTFISDGRLVRIGGPDDAQYVPMVHEPRMAEYDVVVDDAPTSPDMKERVWAMVTQMFPMLQQLPPAAWLELMDYSPFPTSVVQKVKAIAKQQQQQGQADPAQQAQVALAGAMAQKAQADAQLAQARSQHTSAQAQKLQTETALLPNQQQGEMSEAQTKALLNYSQAVNQLQNAGITPQQALHDMQVEAAQLAHDRQMDMAQHALATQQQAHQQGLDQAQHALAVHQATTPPPQAPGP